MPATAPPRPQRLAAVLSILAGRQGRAQAISAPQIAYETGIPERTVRDLLAEHGTGPILGNPGEGYYLPADVEEIHAAHRRLADLSSTAAAKLRRFRAYWAEQGIHLPKN